MKTGSAAPLSLSHPDWTILIRPWASAASLSERAAFWVWTTTWLEEKTGTQPHVEPQSDPDSDQESVQTRNQQMDGPYVFRFVIKTWLSWTCYGFSAVQGGNTHFSHRYDDNIQEQNTERMKKKKDIAGARRVKIEIKRFKGLKIKKRGNKNI